MRGSIIKKVTNAAYKLNHAYAKGKTPYPRVANDYITTPSSYEHPHPPISHFDDYSLPLKKDFYPLVKETLALELTNEAISTPATLVSNIQFLDRLLDKDLSPRKEKEDEIRIRTNNFLEHLEDEISIFGDDILSPKGFPDVNILSHDGFVTKFSPDVTYFKLELVPKKEKEKEEDYKTIGEREENIKDEEIKKPVYISSLKEAVLLYRKKKILLKLFNEKKEKMHEEIAKQKNMAIN